jgi:hypothetical protein
MSRAALAAAAALSLALATGPGCAGLPSFGDELGLSPHWDWKTIETEHFRITFPAELSEIGARTADLYEEAHRLLAPALRWDPAFRTQVIVVDNTDAANGLTTPLGRFGMVLMVTPPDNWFSTAYYEDWLRLLVLHEYAHFLNMDATRGVWAGLRVLFGDVLLPNSTWPVWMLEGLAVYVETRYTRGGRGRSTLYEMILRAAVEADVLGTPDFITLDKVNGDNPYFPGGETPYLFGYQLMNQIARDARLRERGATADAKTTLRDGEEALGVMSERSSVRVPYFINGNLRNVAGRDWRSYWDEWVEDSKRRAREDLARIRSAPVTALELLTERGYGVLGNCSSPDGAWVAYTQDSNDRRSGLHVRDVRTGEVRRLHDKTFGVGMAFTKDSRFVLASSLRRQSLYGLYSDLAAYDVRGGGRTWLTDGARARDPDLSADGRQLVFARSEAPASVGLAIAALEAREGGAPRLGAIRTLYAARTYDRASTPKFSPDGRRVVFTLHRNGDPGEDLMELDLTSGRARPLVRDGRMNRFPAFSPAGDLYFVSDAGGVDNLWHLPADGKPRRVTNVTTGLWLPSFGPTGLYASAFGIDGWNLARVKLPEASARTAALALPAPPAPEPVAAPSPAPVAAARHEIRDYSIFPSIWPRQWLPIAGFNARGVYLAGNVLGFDALDRHRYVLGLGYDTQIRKPDWFAAYSNRSFGPTLTVAAAEQTSDVLYAIDSSVTTYSRERDFSAFGEYPIRWTYSQLTPTFGLVAERIFFYDPTTSNDVPSGRTRYIPSAFGLLTYSDAEASRLAVSPERGRRARIGARMYVDSGVRTWKSLVSDTEYLPLGGHVVLVPQAKASWTSRRGGLSSSGSVVVRGRVNRLVDSLPSDSFDELVLRGYPGVALSSRAAGIGSLDLRFPMARVFRGWGTNPLFLENLFGFVFAESAYFPLSGRSLALPSAGGGVRLSTTLLIHVPLVFSLEYHHGFRDDYGGTGEAFFGLNLGTFEF